VGVQIEIKIRAEDFLTSRELKTCIHYAFSFSKEEIVLPRGRVIVGAMGAITPTTFENCKLKIQ